MAKKFKIYPSVTTHTNWREKIREVNNLGLKEVCIFPTNLNKKERAEMNKLLERSSVKQIPFVHIRHDFTKDEIKYYIDKFNTKYFNRHSKKDVEFEFLNNMSEYNKVILVETTKCGLFPEEVKKYGGLCIDTAHVENQKLKESEIYTTFMSVIENNFPKASHISAIRKDGPEIDPRDGIKKYDYHNLRNLSELDYVRDYKKYLPEIIAIELENSIEEQLNVKKYLEALLS